MWYTPNAYKDIPKYNSNTGKTKGPNPLVIGGFAAFLTIVPVVISCNGPNKPEISDKIELSDLRSDEKEFLKQWKTLGEPYMFENAKAFEKEYLRRGWDTKNLTPAQALEVYNSAREVSIFLGGSGKPNYNLPKD